MSTPSPLTRTLHAVADPPAAPTLELVTDQNARRLRHPDPGAPVNVHRFFFSIGYTGLALVWMSIWLSAAVGPEFEFVGLFGGLFVGLGGLGILIHTLVRPNERKVRHLLLALAALAITGLVGEPMYFAAREMYATAAVSRLQPLADDLARDARIQELGGVNGYVQLNGYQGPEQGPGEVTGFSGSPELHHVLAHHGISRAEFEAYQQRLIDAGMVKMERTAARGLVFFPDGPSGFAMMYVAPGIPLPPPHALVDDHGRWSSKPLGGGWFLLVR